METHWNLGRCQSSYYARPDWPVTRRPAENGRRSRQYFLDFLHRLSSSTIPRTLVSLDRMDGLDSGGFIMMTALNSSIETQTQY